MLTVPAEVFLTGATGDVGSQTLKLLQATGTPCRVLCRRQAQADHFNAQKGVEAVVGNLNDTVEQLKSYMRGCKTFFLLTAPTPDQLAHEKDAIDAALATGTIGFIVKISAGDAREDCNVPWAKAHAAAELHLRERCEKSGVQWTNLRPSGFMTNFLQSAPAIKKGFLPQTSGNGRGGWVDTADIAAVSHRIILDGPGKHASRQYILTGPQLLNMPELAAILSDVLGHRVRYLHLPSPLFKQLVKLGGVDEWMANGLVAQFKDIVRHDLEGLDVSSDIEDITGKPSTSWKKWVEQNKSQLQGFDLAPYLVAGVVGALGAAFYFSTGSRT